MTRKKIPEKGHMHDIHQFIDEKTNEQDLDDAIKELKKLVKDLKKEYPKKKITVSLEAGTFWEYVVTWNVEDLR